MRNEPVISESALQDLLDTLTALAGAMLATVALAAVATLADVPRHPEPPGITAPPPGPFNGRP